MRRLTPHLTYSNTMATVAVFIALGGTSYAAGLGRNTVGPSQIRSKAVGTSELKSRAVTASKIRPGAITTSRLSRSVRESLRGVTGPAGPQGAAGPTGPSGTTYRAAVDSGAGRVAGNATSSGGGSGSYIVGFDRSMAGCVFTATLARVEGGGRVDPEAGRITVAEEGGRIRVRTYGPDGAISEQPFHVLAAC